MSDSISQTGLIVVLIDDEHRMDSRLIAEKLGLEHESFIKTTRTYHAELQELGVVRFEIGKPPQGSLGGRPVNYAMLNEDQCIFIATLSRNTKEVVTFKLALTKAFKEARSGGFNHAISYRLAVTYECLEERVLRGYWSVITEICREVHLAEMLGSFDGGAFVEISVGQHWARYAREVLHVNVDKLPTYQGYNPLAEYKKEFPARLYPLALQREFRHWFRDEYLPNKCPKYALYRKKKVARQISAPAQPKRIR